MSKLVELDDDEKGLEAEILAIDEQIVALQA